MITKILSVAASAAFGAAFGFPKPTCYVMAVVSMVLVCVFRYLSNF